MGASSIIITESNWELLRYELKKKNQKNKFKELLRAKVVPFQELTFEDLKDNQYVIKDAKGLAEYRKDQKTWIIMNIRAFNKEVMRLNTQRAGDTREYYLNLEEAAFQYGNYVVNRQAELQQQEHANIFGDTPHFWLS